MSFEYLCKEKRNGLFLWNTSSLGLFSSCKTKPERKIKNNETDAQFKFQLQQQHYKDSQ